MAWDDDLLDEQRTAAAHLGSNARLLAGPGTGKTLTLTRRVCYLVSDCVVPPSAILAMTFTRAAARELRKRVDEHLGKGNGARISTLHSFALRQLLRNSSRIPALPQPLRIADDWEERNIILEDIKAELSLSRIDEARRLFNELSADWQSLTADEADWESRFPNPEFLGAWREHRQVYGYTLRAELVYQLKKALEQCGEFVLDGPMQHLLVDEYQDLNRCDLAVVQQIESRGVELYAAGDDDQSIYGFRKAHPEGIRRFTIDYPRASSLDLKVCKRCDREILDLGLFVARQDHRRIDKAICCEDERPAGEVAILRFHDQRKEAAGIASLCRHLINDHGLKPDDILILIRSDHNGVFSRTIREAMEGAQIPVAQAEALKPFDTDEGRALLAFMRLATNQQDSLSWRALLQVWCAGVGLRAIGAIYDAARSRGVNFAEIVLALRDDAEILPSNQRSRVTNAVKAVLAEIARSFPDQPDRDYETSAEMMTVVTTAAESLIDSDAWRASVLEELGRTAEAAEAKSLNELIRATEVASEDIEQEIEAGKVNILTMHKAKGLTAEAVIVAAAEDQYIPGRAEGETVDDERRLLYVSLTRAKHYLFVTYCDRRTGQQRHTGRDSGRAGRTLTRFLVDSAHTPADGPTYIRVLGAQHR